MTTDSPQRVTFCHGFQSTFDANKQQQRWRSPNQIPIGPCIRVIREHPHQRQEHTQGACIKLNHLSKAPLPARYNRTRIDAASNDERTKGRTKQATSTPKIAVRTLHPTKQHDTMGAAEAKVRLAPEQLPDPSNRPFGNWAIKPSGKKLDPQGGITSSERGPRIKSMPASIHSSPLMYGRIACR